MPILKDPEEIVNELLEMLEGDELLPFSHYIPYDYTIIDSGVKVTKEGLVKMCQMIQGNFLTEKSANLTLVCGVMMEQHLTHEEYKIVDACLNVCFLCHI